ncbi:hypothetical protein ACE1TF_03950 [Geomicrobium sp. JSM 1781026]|uniref:hypothetical protein n=1 Tax=Geomicrobium sp. JSM 1781026 TaxID=3344580 RepID=UPI0035BFB313
MKTVRILFDVMLLVGLLALFGRFVSTFLEFPGAQFLRDYAWTSILLLIIGYAGSRFKRRD